MGGNYKHCQVLFSHTAQFQCIFLKLPIKTHLLLKSLSLKRNTQEGEKKKKKVVFKDQVTGIQHLLQFSSSGSR